MNYDIYIENLGAIREANVTITPLTILAGENGTGKSFVTKFLYSILNVINTNIYAKQMTTTISQIKIINPRFWIFKSHLQIAINNPQFKLNQIQKKPFEIV